MAKEQLLAIDVGTQSIRALIFDPRGRFDRKVSRSNRTLFFYCSGFG